MLVGVLFFKKSKNCLKAAATSHKFLRWFFNIPLAEMEGKKVKAQRACFCAIYDANLNASAKNSYLIRQSIFMTLLIFISYFSVANNSVESH